MELLKEKTKKIFDSFIDKLGDCILDIDFDEEDIEDIKSDSKKSQKTDKQALV
jgi:hypothetical protein